MPRALESLAVVLLGITVPGALGRAEVLEFTFSGTVDAISGSPAAPWNSTALGDPMTIRYTFESTSPDIFSSGLPQFDDSIGWYDALRSFSVTVGSTTVEASSFGRITAFNNLANTSTHMDLYRADGFLPDGGRAYPFLSEEAFPNVPVALSSDGLPDDLVVTVPPWTDAYIVLDSISGNRGAAGYWEVVAAVDTFERRVVPAPGFVPAVALCCIAMWRRRGAAHAQA